MMTFEPTREAEAWIEPGFEAADPTHVCSHTRAGAICRIRSFSMCNALCGPAADQLEALARPTVLPARRELLTQGAPNHSLYNIVSGMVRLSRLAPDGRHQVIGFALPGDIIGTLKGGPSHCSAHTLTEVSACRFDRVDFARFVESQPPLLRRVFALVGKELTLAQEHMTLLGRGAADEKVACFLLDLRRRLVRSVGLSDVVPLPMSRQDIADYLGLTIETVSRVLTRLDRAGMLAVARDKVRIIDVPQLEAVATGASIDPARARC